MVLSSDLFPHDEQEFASLHFGACDLGDARRTRLLVSFAGSVARSPGSSIPALCGGRSAGFNAVYDLLKADWATPEALQDAHTTLVRRDIAGRAGSTVLVIDDGSDLSWSGNAPVDGLGQVSNGKDPGLQGFHVHTALAVSWPAEDPGDGRRPPLELLGIAAQLFHVRPHRAPAKAGVKKKKVRRGPEGRLWRQAGERIGPAPRGVRLVRVGDRGGDMFEFLDSCRGLGHGFIVRASQNRRLATGDGSKKYLLDEARAAAPLEGEITIELRARPGEGARTARLRASVAPLTVAVPKRLARKEGPEPAAVTVVRLHEPRPAEGAEPLEWILLCDGAVTTFAQAAETARMYAARWFIEEYHKGLKTGMKIESLQLGHGKRLMAAAAVMAIVALRLLAMREQARARPDAPAGETGLAADELEVLEALTGRQIRTCREAVRAMASLGGFAGRKCDKEPGWQTLHKGHQLLQANVNGFRLAEHRRSQE